MTAQTRATLKTYYLTGLKPTQVQFANTIDSFLSLLDTTAQVIASPITVSGAATFSSTVSAASLNVSGTTTLSGALSLAAVSAASLNVAGATILSGPLAVAAVSAASLNVAGNSILTGTLNVAGAATFVTQAVGNSTTLAATTAFVNRTSSLLSTGYVTFANGLIIQWGSTSVTAGGLSVTSLPITFPNNIFSVTGSIDSLATTAVQFATANPTSTSTISLSINTGSNNCRWIAIGN